MNNDDIGKVIKDIRLKNNLSQKDFAEKFGVTYQAVSKWENGKNIPDIAIIKEICQEYDLSLDELLNNKPSKNKWIFILIGGVLMISIITLLIILTKSNNNFEFKQITSNCHDFKVTGSMAYNKDKTSIYISEVNYCGEDEDKVYDDIVCTFYEDSGDTKKVIEKCQPKENMSIKDFLKNINFHIDNYAATCKNYTENSLYLEIEVTKNKKTNAYIVPLKLVDNCK